LRSTIAVCSRGLQLDRAAHGVDHAAELDNEAVAHALDHPPAVDGDRRVDEVAAKRSESSERALLVGGDQPAIADDVGGEDRGNFSRLGHRAPQPRRRLARRRGLRRIPLARNLIHKGTVKAGDSRARFGIIRRKTRSRSMKAWRLEKLGGRLALEDVPVPEPRPSSVLIRVEATTLLSYLKAYVEGKLPFYNPPAKPFTIGTNAIGTVAAVGRDVWSLEKGQRVVLSPHFVARENVDDPAQILIGLTSGAGAAEMLADWPDGTLAEYALAPVAAVTPLDGFDGADAAQLAALSRFIVPYGGLLRGRLAAGETLVVNGATGAYGTAAVLLGIAMGAARVIAAGRNFDALAAVAVAAGPRVAPVALAGDVAADAKAIRQACGGGADLAFDMVGNATDSRSTVAALTSLKRNGTLVLMGSMTVDLPVPYTQVMLNNWEIFGQFMYPASAYRRLLDLVRSGLLDSSAIKPRVFALSDLAEAMEAASAAGNLEVVVVRA